MNMEEIEEGKGNISWIRTPNRWEGLEEGIYYYYFITVLLKEGSNGGD